MVALAPGEDRAAAAGRDGRPPRPLPALGTQSLGGDRHPDLGRLVVAPAAPASVSSRRKRTTVMLSRPPAALASAISRSAARSRSVSAASTAAICSSPIIDVRPSEHISTTSPARTG